MSPRETLDEENSLLISNLLLQVSLQYQQSLCLVTHDLDLAKKCDRIIQIENGKLL
jgi:predicted ABC-type transport system involved in lysophospholipase L1 biosynthesis ATPase subunit